MDKIKEVMDLVFAFELEISEASVLEELGKRESAKDVYQKADSIKQSIESKLRELLEREPLSEKKKRRIINNWFAEKWAQEQAVGVLHDYELEINRANGIGNESKGM